MNEQKQFNKLDDLNVISFFIGIYALYISIENLQENRSQSNSQEEIMNKLDKHLTHQDEQYNKIIERLEKLEGGKP